MPPRRSAVAVALLTLTLALASCRHPAPDKTAAGTGAAAVPGTPHVAAGCDALRAGGVAVSLTYDDNLPSQLEVAAPELARYNLPATFFVEDVRADSAPWRALHAHGHEIGAHTMNHPCPRSNSWVKAGFASEDYDLPRMTAELDDNIALLRSLGQTGPLSFAYPCGITTVGERQESYVAVVKERFAAARMSSPGVAARTVDLYQTPGIDTATTGSALIGWVTAAARGGGGWSIIVFHGVGGDYLSVSRDAHAELLAYLDGHRSTIWTAPFGTVAACLHDR